MPKLTGVGMGLPRPGPRLEHKREHKRIYLTVDRIAP